MQETVPQLQQGGRSPKSSNGPTSASQLKSSADTMQTSTGSFSSQSKGKKKEQRGQVSEILKHERDLRTDEDSGHVKADSLLKSEIASMTERGGLVDFGGVEKLVQLIQPEKPEKKIDWTSRSMLAGVIAATDQHDCLGRFVELRGLVVLDEWLQEVHKGKVGDSSSPKDKDKSVEEFILVLLRALDKLPVNLNALETCNIGKSVNHLRSHRNSEIQKKARSLVDTWKKRVEAEMNISDAKSAQLSSSKSAPVKLVQLEFNGKLSTASPGSLKTALPASPNANCRDGQLRVSVAGANPELPQISVRDEKSSGSNQSHTNTQCSGEHGKNVVPLGKEDRRSSMAGATSMSKITGSASRYRRSPNGLHGAAASVGQRECGSSRNSEETKIYAPDKSSQSPLTGEKTSDAPIADGNNHKRVVKIPNRGRSPAQNIIGGSMEDPTFTISRASSPVDSEKHDQSGYRVMDNTDASRAISASKMNTESWHSNVLKDVASDGVVGSQALATDCIHCQAANDFSQPANVHRPASTYLGDEIKPTKAPDSSFSSINALIDSCVKYSQASENPFSKDDVGMNLLASVAAGEITKSGVTTPTDSPNIAEEPCTVFNGASQVNEDDPGSQSSASGKDLTEIEDACLRSNGKSDGLVGSAFQQTEKTAGEEFPEGKPGLEDEIQCSVSDRQSMGINMASKSKDSSSPKEETLDMTAEILSACTTGKVDEKNNANQDVNSNVLVDRKTSAQGPLLEPENEEISVTSGDGKSLPAENFSILKIGDTINFNALAHFDKVIKLKYDQENVATETLQKPDDSDMGFAVLDRKNNGHVEDLRGKGAFGRGLGRLSSQNESNIIAAKEPSTNLNGPVSEAVEGTVMEKWMSSAAGGSVPSESSDTDGKLSFDLNEDLNVDDSKCIDSVNSAPPGFPAPILLGSVPSYCVPSTSIGLPASVTIASAAKGPFVPPEDLLRNKGELGWKGSAATSAFRPAEPRKVSETIHGMYGVPLDSSESKQGKAPLEFDLNVADEMILEDMGCESSTPVKVDTRSSSLLVGGQAATSSLCCSGGLDLDLNRIDQVPELGHRPNIHRYESLLPPATPSSSSGLSQGEGSSKRTFDLNNGPAVDEAVGEPLLYNKTRVNFPIQPYVRINNTDIGSLTSWYPPGNSYSAVPIPSFFPDRGERPFPVVGVTAGSQRSVSEATGKTPFNADANRGPALSSSSALPFPSTPFQYPVFPFPLPPSTFSGGSAAYMDFSSGGRPCFPAVPSQLIGTATAVPFQYPRPYVVTLPDIGNSSGVDGSRKFGRQGLDLNTGPGVLDVDGRNETASILSRQVPSTNSFASAEEQARLHHLTGSGLKRKEPEGGWDGDRLSFKQASWK